MKFLKVGAVALVCLSGPGAMAQGFGESTPYQFRSPSERQVLLNYETLRLQLAGAGVGSAAGLGTQTGNVTTINIDGTGNTVDVGQDNSGDQTIQESGDGGSNSTALAAPPPSSQMLN